MTARHHDFDQMIETIRQSASDPDDVTVGAFAKAVERLQAELAMLEAQVDRIGAACDKAFDGGDTVAAPPTGDVPPYRAANRP